MTTEKRESPQKRAKCACPSWTSARECIHLRYASNGVESWEKCECSCHADDDDDDDGPARPTDATHHLLN